MLDESKLRAALLRFFRLPGGIRSIGQAEEKWANAYDEYARDAEDLSGDSVATVNSPGFLAALDFRSIRQTSQMAAQLESGFSSYWTGAVFGVASLIVGLGSPCLNVSPSPSSTLIFASEATSAVSAVASGAMRSAVLPHLQRNFSGVMAEDQAGRVASAMHQATISAVTVLITGIDTALPGVGGPFAVTNTCTIS